MYIIKKTKGGNTFRSPKCKKLVYYRVKNYKICHFRVEVENFEQRWSMMYTIKKQKVARHSDLQNVKN